MKTTLLLAHHCRCTRLLELIAQCDERMMGYRKRVEEIENGYGTYKTKERLLNQWQTTLNAKERLAKMYAATLAKIVKPTIDKILCTPIS